jgi:hypothetical protein
MTKEHSMAKRKIIGMGTVKRLMAEKIDPKLPGLHHSRFFDISLYNGEMTQTIFHLNEFTVGTVQLDLRALMREAEKQPLPRTAPAETRGVLIRFPGMTVLEAINRLKELRDLILPATFRTGLCMRHDNVAQNTIGPGHYNNIVMPATLFIQDGEVCVPEFGGIGKKNLYNLPISQKMTTKWMLCTVPLT